MDAPDELRRTLADAMASADANQEFTYPELADAVLAVPAIAAALAFVDAVGKKRVDAVLAALARDAQVAEIVAEGCPEASPNRLVLLSARYRSIAALYPEAGKP